MTTSTFDSRIDSLDVSLFQAIPTQTSENDRKALLFIQGLVRQGDSPYTYLEIGSHLGGSLQPHVLDNRCGGILSIDKRPAQQPDERWSAPYQYPDNSTQRMLDNLGRLAPQGLSKVRTWDCASSAIPKDSITPAPDLLFIDAEHTDRAVQTDFHFCLSVRGEDSILAFHDAQVVYRGLHRCINHLNEKHLPYRAELLGDSVFVIYFGRFAPTPRHNRNLKRTALAPFFLTCYARYFLFRPMHKLLQRILQSGKQLVKHIFPFLGASK